MWKQDQIKTRGYEGENVFSLIKLDLHVGVLISIKLY